MQLQKLVFLAQGYCLALLDRPAYYHNTHAWQWGPVVPKLYKQLQKYESGPVTEEIQAQDNLDEAGEEYRILQAVWDSYSHYSGSQLSAITHRPGSPWSNTWEKNKFGVIPEDDIRDYYRALLAAK